MKTLIISDAHFSVENVKLALSSHPETRFLLFLGDGCKEMTRLMDFYPRVAFIAVKGNCDLFENDYPPYRTAVIGGVKVFLCHGNGMGVRHGGPESDVLAYRARKENCKICFFGHTHVPLHETVGSGEDAVVLFNPGSITEPRGSSDFSYGVMETDGNGNFTLRHENVY
ncbi:MAG: YfcE family phosphodiesterase [Ruminococcaceae bacterium]|nr:YfcE family phosphodiesterase [Oscillospiraceae bacterium]MBQ9691880.1 YfcE family phosphodiesterase [Clostridia bacterium]